MALTKPKTTQLEQHPDAKKHKVIGRDGEPLKNGEWEFFGTRIPSLMNKIINQKNKNLSEEK